MILFISFTYLLFCFQSMRNLIWVNISRSIILFRHTNSMRALVYITETFWPLHEIDFYTCGALWGASSHLHRNTMHADDYITCIYKIYIQCEILIVRALQLSSIIAYNIKKIIYADWTKCYTFQHYYNIYI